MGANEKLQAAMHGFIPATDEVRALYVAGTPTHRVSVHSGHAEFDRWLETVRAEAKVEALNDAAHALDSATINIEVLNGDPDLKQAWAFRSSERKSIIQSLRARANQYKEAPSA